MALRVALFVEGSHAPPSPRGVAPLERIWNGLAAALNLQAFDSIIPISKKHLVAMDPSSPPMSGSSEGLDQLMARRLLHTPFDAAVVAWDLAPPWNANGQFCRRQETLDLYRFLSESDALTAPWRELARGRLDTLTRAPSSPPRRTTRLQRYEVLALCMEPCFEGLLTQDERAIRKVLGLTTTPEGWPTIGWGDPNTRRPDDSLIRPAIAALRTIRPVPKICRQIPGDFRTNKDGWGEVLIRELLKSADGRSLVLKHPISRRLSEHLPTAT